MTLSLRHDWARRHRPLLIVLALIVSSVFALVILPQLGRATVRAGIVAATVTALYFFAFRFSGHRLAFIRCLPAKEFAIGATFAGGIALAASGGSFEAVPLATLAGMTLLFTGNCLVIARAEEAWDQEADPASFYTKGLPPTRLPEVLLGLTFLVGLVKCSSDPGLGPVALLLSAAATLALALFPNRQYFQALADGVLLLPWIVLWVNR